MSPAKKIQNRLQVHAGARFNPMKYLVLLAIIVVPSIYAGILTWANYDPTDTINAVPAAIVNQDQPATSSQGQLNLGQDLTQQLLDNESKNNFDWSTMEADEARSKLENGQVQAVLTIPEDFSASVAALGENKAEAAQVAKLDIATNDGSNIISGNIASAVGTAVADGLAQKVSAQYLTGIYAGFTSINGSLGQAADGSQQLADGAVQASDGSQQLVLGLSSLRSGADSLASGTSSLADGAGQVNSGAQSLATGSSSLADGANQVNEGASSLATGTSSLASGAAQANSGAQSLATGSSSLADGANQVNEGASSLATGLAQADSGAQSLASGLSQINEGTSALPSQLPALTSGTEALASGAQQVASGAERLDSAASQLATGSSSLAEGAGQALAGAQRLSGGASQLAGANDSLASGASTLAASSQQLVDSWDSLTDDQRLAALKNLNGAASQLSAGASAADAAASSLAEGASALVGGESSGLTKLSAGASALSSGASSLAEGTGKLKEGASAVSEGASQLNTQAGGMSSSLLTLSEAVAQANEGASSLAAGTGQLSAGASSLADGTGSLASGANQLKDGASTLADGTGSLASGANQLKDGASTLADGTGSLASGANQLKDGASTLADGTGSLASGANQLKDGAAQLSAGATSASDGASSLASGLGDLQDGNQQLATSLGQAVGQVPSFTTQEADDLSSVSSRPVDISKTRLNEVATYGHGLAPYFMTLGLWVGAIAYFMMYPAISRKFARSGHSGLATLRGALIPVVLMGIAQGIVMPSIIHLWVGIETANFWGLVGFSILTSITFLAINQALIALLDAPGRFIALVLTVLQVGAAAGTYPIETAPAFLQAIHPWLPLTHALEAFRSFIAGGSLGVGVGLAWLAGWFSLAVCGTAFSIWRRHRREERAEAERLARRAKHLDDQKATA